MLTRVLGSNLLSESDRPLLVLLRPLVMRTLVRTGAVCTDPSSIPPVLASSRIARSLSTVFRMLLDCHDTIDLPDAVDRQLAALFWLMELLWLLRLPPLYMLLLPDILLMSSESRYLLRSL